MWRSVPSGIATTGCEKHWNCCATKRCGVFGAFLLSGSVRAKQAQIERRGGGEEIALHSNAWFVKHI
jgi:hypothetical protein